MTGRKFYKTVLRVEVLSEDQLGWGDLSDVHHAITEGNCSGSVKEVSRKELTGLQAAKELGRQGSEPGFFGLDDKGEEV